MARTRIHMGAILAIALSVLFIYGCMAGSYSTSNRNGHEKVYRNDEGGGKTLVYEVAKDGTVTIHDADDPKAQEIQEAQQRQEMSEAADAERLVQIEAAPKREPGSPIYVGLYETELDPQLKQAQHSEGAVFEELRKNFEGDSVILLGGNGQTQSSLTQFTRALNGESTKAGPATDVNVWSTATIEERAGIDRKTGKLGKMAVIVFEAQISSNYLPATYTVTEEGNIFRNDEVTRRFAEKIKHVIKTEIGPTIPADRSL